MCYPKIPFKIDGCRRRQGPVTRQVPMRSRKIGRLFAWLWIPLWVCAAQPTPQGTAPLWSQDVIADDLTRTSPGLPPSLLDGSRGGVAFLNNGQLMVYAVEPTGQLSSRRSPEISSAFQLSLSLLDAKSGDVALTKDWGTRRRDSAVQVTSGGVLVKTGGIVKLYSTDFAQARDLPLVLDPNGIYYTSVSASGRTVAISHYFKKQQRWISHFDVLDATTLKIRSSWDQYPPIFQLSMSDERFVTIGVGNSAVSLSDFGSAGQSKVVSAVPVLKGCPAGGTARVVSEDSIILRHCQDVLLLTIDGKSSSLDTLNGDAPSPGPVTRCGLYFGWLSRKTAEIATTSDARFVALSLPAINTKKHLLREPSVCLTELQVAVYDLSRKQRVFIVDVDPLPKNDYDFALSPDGSKLAVLSDRRASVYSVPVPASK